MTEESGECTPPSTLCYVDLLRAYTEIYPRVFGPLPRCRLHVSVLERQRLVCYALNIDKAVAREKVRHDAGHRDRPLGCHYNVSHSGRST